MPRLPVLTPKKLIRILRGLGFQLDHKTGSHYIFYDSKSKRRATVAFHTKELPKGTLISILNQTGITKEELRKHL